MALVPPVVSVLARSYARRQRGALAVLGLLTAVGVTATLVPIAAAARTGSVADRALDAVAFHDVSVDVAGITAQQLDPLRRDPLVTEMGVLGFSAVRPVGSDLVPGIDMAGVMPLDSATAQTIQRPRIIEGRAPRVDRIDEVLINPVLARRLDLRVGSPLRLESYRQDQVNALFRSPTPPPPAGAVLDTTVVGIGEDLTEVVEESGDFGVILHSYAAFQRYGTIAPDMAVADQEIGFFRILLQARLVRGERDVPAFIDRVAQAYGSGDSTTVFSEQRSDVFGAVEQSLSVEALALLLFGIAAGLATVVTVGQALSRQSVLLAIPAEVPTRSLGIRVRHRVAAAVVPAAIAALAGVAVAVLAAIAASGSFPRGLGRRLEPDPGLRIEPLVLGAGPVIIFMLLLVVLTVAALRLTRGRRVSESIGRLRLPLGRADIGMGIRMATHAGRGATRVPTGQAFLGASAAVTGVLAALVFGASLSTLVTTPRLYGVDADISIPLQTDSGGKVAAREGPILAADEDVAGLAWYGSFELEVARGVRMSGVAIRYDKGVAGPVALAGRLPRGADEIAVSPAAAGTDLALGETVVLASGESARCRVVGYLAGHRNDFVVTEAGAARLGVSEFDDQGFSVRLAPGVDAGAARRRLGERFAEIYPVAPGPEVANLALVRSFPAALAGLLAVLGAGAVVHLLASATRRRARDLAMLKVLGFRRSMVRSTVRWQAVTVAATGVVVGTVVGIGAGRAAWALVTDGLGVLYAPVVEVGVIAVTALTTIVVALLAAVWPGRVAARTHPGVTLRAE